MSVLRACGRVSRRSGVMLTCERPESAVGVGAVIAVCCSHALSPLFARGWRGVLRVCACVVVGGWCFRGGYWRGVMLGFLVRTVLLRGAW